MRSNKKIIGAALFLFFAAIFGVRLFYRFMLIMDPRGESISNRPSFAHPADVANPVEVTAKSFSVEIPGNWRADKKITRETDVEALNIRSPGQSFITLSVVSQPLDISDTGKYARKVARHLKEMEATTEPFSEETFTTWGEYSGKGVRLLNSDMEIREFRFSDRQYSFSATEVHRRIESDYNAFGFDLIRSTLKLSRTKRQAGGNTQRPAIQ